MVKLADKLSQITNQIQNEKSNKFDQYEQKSMNFSNDIWQVGILAFKILFNRHPFLSRKDENGKKTKSEKMKIIQENLEKGDYYIDLINEYRCEISKEVLVFFSQVLKKDQKQ